MRCSKRALDAEVGDEIEIVLRSLLLLNFVPPDLGALRRALFSCSYVPARRNTRARQVKDVQRFAQFSRQVRNSLHDAPIFLEDVLVSA